MPLTDPIADLLTRIRNANSARKDRVEVSHSGVKEQLVRVITEEGFISSYSVVGNAGVKSIRIFLKYDDRKHPVITGLRRISKPSVRVYVGKDEIPPVRRGLGVNILSTSAGIMADREARNRGLGGELVCSVW